MAIIDDTAFIKNISPLSFLYFLCKGRFDSTINLLTLQDALKIDIVISQLKRPVNPLLLASAISISLVKKYDFRSFLSHYISGFELPDLEEHLLRLPKFESEEELSAFLRLEISLVEALRLLPLSLMLPIATSLEEKYMEMVNLPEVKTSIFGQLRNIMSISKFLDFEEIISHHYERYFVMRNSSSETNQEGQAQPDITSILATYWEQLSSSDVPEDWKFNRFTVIYYAWTLFNPIYLLTGMGKELSTFANFNFKGDDVWNQPDGILLRLLRQHGRTTNDPIHNAREYYQEELHKAKIEYNGILKSSLAKEEKKKQLGYGHQRLLNAEKLAKRAYRFYQWNPEELYAHEAQERTLKEKMKLDPKVKSLFSEESLERLPPELREYRTHLLLHNYGE